MFVVAVSHNTMDDYGYIRTMKLTMIIGILSHCYMPLESHCNVVIANFLSKNPIRINKKCHPHNAKDGFQWVVPSQSINPRGHGHAATVQGARNPRHWHGGPVHLPPRSAARLNLQTFTDIGGLHSHGGAPKMMVDKGISNIFKYPIKMDDD